MTRFGAEDAALFGYRLATAFSRRLKAGIALRVAVATTMLGMAIASSAPAQELTPLPDCGCPAGSVDRDLRQLKQRVAELECMLLANEDATRTIIRQSFAERQAQINDYVTFGGTLEVLTGWAEDFDGQSESDIVLDTAQLDFEIQVNNWTLGSIVFEYDDGTNVLFPTTEQSDAFVDRLNVDTAFVTLGDTQQCPLFMTAGRIIAPFGISTGDPVADVLTIEDPLTIEVFEMREDAILFGFEILDPAPNGYASKPQVTPLPVDPLVVNPFFRRLGLGANGISGYPRFRRPRPTATSPLTPPTSIWRPSSAFNGAVYLFNGDTNNGIEDHIEHVGCTLGYRAQGILAPCLPWSLDLDVDYTSSVFDSRFLAFEYRPFLDRIGYVPGMAAHAKSSLGPVALVFEWNGAVRDAAFLDDLGNDIRIAPSAWQVSLGYQFGWNPTVQVIGEQGTYFTVGYSESRDLAGVTRVIDGVENRVGFVPQKRFLVGVGEWVLDGFRISLEYSHIVDYAQADGGTGNTADGYFAMFTYVW